MRIVCLNEKCAGRLLVMSYEKGQLVAHCDTCEATIKIYREYSLINEKTIELTLDVVPGELRNRRCARCGSHDFRELTFISNNEKLRLSITDAVAHMYNPAANSQSTIPLAICVNCKRLVSLI